MMPRHLLTAIVLFALLTVTTGIVYPLLITGIAQLAFPQKANGSLILKNRKAYGSELIGQSFANQKYFRGRPSATEPVSYNTAASSGSNYGPLNPSLVDAVQKRIKELKDSDPRNSGLIPVDLVTASGSGLDPHISPSAAIYQLHRVARIRGMNEEAIRALVNRCTEERQFGFLGEPRVNVLRLNLALDEFSKGNK